MSNYASILQRHTPASPLMHVYVHAHKKHIICITYVYTRMSYIFKYIRFACMYYKYIIL